MPHIESYLKALMEGDATDLHLRGGSAPYWRVNGELLPHGDPLPEGENFESLLLALLRIARIKSFPDRGDLDFTFDSADGRFRAHLFPSKEGLNAVIRRIPARVPLPKDLALPDALRAVAGASSGLVLLCGPSGSGKTTTAASLVESINIRDPRYVITVEGPVEYRFRSRQSVVHQITVGRDVPTFSAGIRAALSARADVLFVGDLVGEESVRLALVAADTGALVFATLHANGAVEALDRLLDLLPQESHALNRAALAQTLRMVSYQVLLPSRRGGVVAAFEVIAGTPAVQNVVRENKTHELLSVIQSGRAAGMRSLDDSLETLVKKHVVPREVAAMHARNRSRFEVAKRPAK